MIFEFSSNIKKQTKREQKERRNDGSVGRGGIGEANIKMHYSNPNSRLCRINWPNEKIKSQQTYRSLKSIKALEKAVESWAQQLAVMFHAISLNLTQGSRHYIPTTMDITQNRLNHAQLLKYMKNDRIIIREANKVNNLIAAQLSIARKYEICACALNSFVWIFDEGIRILSGGFLCAQ